MGNVAGGGTCFITVPHCDKHLGWLATRTLKTVLGEGTEAVIVYMFVNRCGDAIRRPDGRDTETFEQTLERRVDPPQCKVCTFVITTAADGLFVLVMKE